MSAFGALKRVVSQFAGASESRPTPQAGFLRGGSGGKPYIFSSPPLRDVTDDIKQAWTPVAARTIEALQNNGWIAGGVEAAISTIIGTGLVLNAKPDHEALGWSTQDASAWARKVERRYHARCRNKWAVDAGGRYTGGQLEAAHLRQYFATGEGISQFLTIPRPGIAGNTRMRLLQSHLLSRETDVHTRLHQGVRLDRHGAPASYRFRMKDKHGVHEDIEFRAKDRFGRTIINHIFDGQAGQFRGITVIAPVLKTIHRYDRLAGSTMAAALLHQHFAATIESDYPTEQVLDALGSSSDRSLKEQPSPFQNYLHEIRNWHETVDIELAGVGKIPHLLTGEKLNLQSAKHPNSNYEPFANFLLREIARCLGCLFEDLTGDYRGASYSSLQNGIAKIWPITLYRRQHIAVPFKQADYDAWLEEEIDAGRIEFPGGIDGFVANREAATRAEWRGPPKPVADELKAAKSDEIYYRLGVRSQSRIAADKGDDIDTIHEDFEREAESRKQRGIPDPSVGSGGDAVTDAADEAIEERDAA